MKGASFLAVAICVLLVGPSLAPPTTADSTAVQATTLPQGLTGSAAVWAGTHAFVFGGLAPTGYVDDILRYDPAVDQLDVMNAALPTPRSGMSAVWDGVYVYLFGGWDGTNALNQIVRYDPATDTVSVQSAQLPTARKGTSAAWDGQYAYVFGGWNSAGYNKQVLRYDTSAGILTTLTVTLPVTGADSSALWTGEDVLIFGGANGAFPSDRILRFEPSTSTITDTQATLPTGRRSMGAVWDGTNAYLFGGYDSNIQDSQVRDIVRYDPANNLVTLMAAGLPSVREGASAVYDGSSAHVFGGWDTSFMDEIVRYELTPGAPENLVAALGATGVNLTWSPPPSNSFDSPIINYRVYRGSVGAALALIRDVGPATAFQDDTIQPGAGAYQYAVSAVTIRGEGPQSSHANVLVARNEPVLGVATENSPDTNGTVNPFRPLETAPEVVVRRAREFPTPVPPTETGEMCLKGAVDQECALTFDASQVPSWIPAGSVIWDQELPTAPESIPPGPLAPVSASVSTTLFEDQFNGNGLDTSKWTVVNQGFGVRVQNGRLELSVQEQGSTTVEIKSQSISRTFTSSEGVQVNTRAQRSAEGNGWVAVNELYAARSDDSSKWIRLSLDPWSQKVTLRDSTGTTNVLSSTSGQAVGYHEVALIVTGSSYTGVFDSLRATQSSSLFAGASSFFVRLRDSTGGSTSGASETSWRDSIVVQSLGGGANNVPNKPFRPQGPETATTRSTYWYSSSASDPDGGNLEYVFYWFDGQTYRTGAQSSGVGASAPHAWQNSGTYDVSVVAYDASGAASPPSDTLRVVVTDASAGDSYEPDGDFANARTITPSGTAQAQTRSISPAGEYDYVKFHASSGNTYQFFSTGQTDTHATLYNPSQTSITSDDDGNGFPNFRLQFTAITTGWHYLAIRGYNAHSTVGDYSLYYLMQSSSPPEPPLIHGTSSATQNVEYPYYFRSRDPDNNNVKFEINWGDGTPITITGTTASDSTLSKPHSFAATGTFNIYARAIDSNNQKSGWSTYPFRVTVTAPAAPTCKALQEGGKACDVIVMHGWAGVSANGATDMRTWTNLKNVFGEYYAVHRASYYGDACGVEDDIANGLYGSHSTWHPRSHHNTQGCDTNAAIMPHDTSENIEHLGYHTAWYVYQKYTTNSRPVDMVVHSMGGLVTRYAAAMVVKQDAAWPPSLDVEDIVTFGTPHYGVQLLCKNYPGANHQGDQMCDKSGFIKWLRQNAQNPQPSKLRGTEWALYSSVCDTAVPPEAGTYGSPGGMVSDWYVVYGNDVRKKECYEHSGYYTDTEPAWDAYYRWGSNKDNPGYMPTTEWAGAPHFGQEALQSILYHGW